MKLDAINQWLTLIANFGIVAGLAIVFLELNHATKLAETEAYVERARAVGDHFTLLALSGDLAEIVQKQLTTGLDSLTDVEQRRLFGWELARTYRVHGQYYQYQQGFLDEEAIQYAMKLGALPQLQLWRELGIVIENKDLLNALEKMEAESK